MSNARVFIKVREIQRKETNKIISSHSELELPARNKTHRFFFSFHFLVHDKCDVGTGFTRRKYRRCEAHLESMENLKLRCRSWEQKQALRLSWR